jgi:hypothetical protein
MPTACCTWKQAGAGGSALLRLAATRGFMVAGLRVYQAPRTAVLAVRGYGPKCQRLPVLAAQRWRVAGYSYAWFAAFRYLAGIGAVALLHA